MSAALSNNRPTVCAAFVVCWVLYDIEINNEWEKIIKFRGVGAEDQGVADPTFGRPK